MKKEKNGRGGGRIYKRSVVRFGTVKWQKIYVPESLQKVIAISPKLCTARWSVNHNLAAEKRVTQCNSG